MTITLAQAVILGLLCGIGKTCIFYAPGVFMFNTVVFNSFLVGLVLGNVPEAMIIGAAVQLVYLGVTASGGTQATDPCMAAYVAIPVAMVAGLDTTAAIAVAVPVGLLGAQLLNLLYLANGFFAQKGDTFIEKDDARGMTRWSVIYCAIIRVVVFAVPTAVAVYIGSSALQGVLDNIPEFLTNGLSAVGACLPAVGFAIIASLIAKPKYIPFFFAGFFLIQYTGIGTIPLLMIGAFLTFLYVTFTKSEYMSDDEDEDDEDDDEEEESGGKLLSKWDVVKSYFIFWTTAELSHSFERMQAPSFCTALAPYIKKFYPGEENKEKRIEALKRHMTFFNTEAHWGGGPILGLTLAMEEKKSRNYEAIPGEVIMNIKTGLMGPLAGIGDTISWSTLMYLLIALFLPLAEQGNALGGIAPIVIFAVICFGIGSFLAVQCYTFGYSFAEKMLKSGLVNVIIAAASILGLFMMGGLSATYVTVSTPLTFTTSTFSTTLQSILDSIAPGILPLLVVLGVWGYLAKVKRNYFVVTVGLTVIALVLGCLGIIG